MEVVGVALERSSCLHAGAQEKQSKETDEHTGDQTKVQKIGTRRGKRGVSTQF